MFFRDYHFERILPYICFFLRIPLNHQDYSVSHQEVGVLMLIGVAAHAHGPVWEIAEHAAPARRLLRSRHASILLFPPLKKGSMQNQ